MPEEKLIAFLKFESNELNPHIAPAFLKATTFSSQSRQIVIYSLSSSL
jgi:hypothetical protein